MNYFEISVWGTSLLMMAATVYYCTLLYKGKINPPPATFIILSITFPLMYYMYIKGNQKWSWDGNIGLTSAVISVWVICFYYIIYLKKFSISFSKFHISTIASSLLVLIYWVFTQKSFNAYVALQVAALIGYIPIIETLLRGENKDSLIFWFCIFLSALVAAYAAYKRSDLEAWIYIARASLSTGLVLYLMVRAQKNKGGALL